MITLSLVTVLVRKSQHGFEGQLSQNWAIIVPRMEIFRIVLFVGSDGSSSIWIQLSNNSIAILKMTI